MKDRRERQGEEGGTWERDNWSLVGGAATGVVATDRFGFTSHFGFNLIYIFIHPVSMSSKLNYNKLLRTRCFNNLCTCLPWHCWYQSTDGVLSMEKTRPVKHVLLPSPQPHVKRDLQAFHNKLYLFFWGGGQEEEKNWNVSEYIILNSQF